MPDPTTTILDPTQLPRPQAPQPLPPVPEVGGGAAGTLEGIIGAIQGLRQGHQAAVLKQWDDQQRAYLGAKMSLDQHQKTLDDLETKDPQHLNHYIQTQMAAATEQRDLALKALSEHTQALADMAQGIQRRAAGSSGGGGGKKSQGKNGDDANAQPQNPHLSALGQVLQKATHAAEQVARRLEGGTPQTAAPAAGAIPSPPPQTWQQQLGPGGAAPKDVPGGGFDI